jgi:endo-1,4-beta-xylanase
MLTVDQVKARAAALGADLCGIAASWRFSEAPAGFRTGCGRIARLSAAVRSAAVSAPRSRLGSILLFLLSLQPCPPLAAQTTDPLYESYFLSETADLPGRRTRLFDTAALSNFRLTADASKASMKKIRVAGMPFGIAFRIEVEQQGPNSWDPQLMTAVSASAVKADDVLLYVFYSRTAASSDPSALGKIFAMAQLSRSPWTGLVNIAIRPDSSWRRTIFSARAGRNYAAGEIEAAFHLGYFPQTVDIGGVIALNLGSVDENLLPTNTITYGGREPDAPWRAAAAERIDRIRKADITVRVTDPAGKPVVGAAVRIRMKRHAFGFGTFNPVLTLPDPSDLTRYHAALFKYFNKVTTPFYWADSTGIWGWESAQSSEYRNYCLDMAAWNRANGFRIRGHNLVWPGWQWLPPRIRVLAADTAALRQAVLAHIREVAAAARPFGLEEWDVVNEPYLNHDLIDLLGERAVAEWFEAAREADPGPSLVINETGDITGGGNAGALDRLDGLASFLLERGAPLGGLGFQAHFGGDLTDIPAVLEIFDRFQRFGVPLRITEFDIDTRDLELQADYTRDLLTAVFSHPAMDSFVQWGFWEGDHWRPNGAMIRRDWTPKPNALAYESLVLGEWWTDVSGLTDAFFRPGIPGMARGYRHPRRGQ